MNNSYPFWNQPDSIEVQTKNTKQKKETKSR